MLQLHTRNVCQYLIKKQILPGLGIRLWNVTIYSAPEKQDRDLGKTFTRKSMIQPDLEGSKVWVHNIAECIKTHFGVTDRILHLEKTSEITHFTMVKQRSLFNRCEHICKNKTQEATRAPSRTLPRIRGSFASNLDRLSVDIHAFSPPLFAK